MTLESIPIEIVLDRCLKAIREGNYSLDECLAHYKDHKETLEPLLLLVLRLQSGRTLEAPAEFRQGALTRLEDWIDKHPRPGKRRARIRLALLQKSAGVSPASSGSRFSLIFTVILILVIGTLLVAGFGTVRASRHALPGNVFYPIKGTVEMVQLAVTSDPMDKASLYLDLSQERLEEADVLLRTQQLGEVKYSLLEYQVESRTTLQNLGEASGLTPEQRLNLARQTLDCYSKNESHLQALETVAPEIVCPEIGVARDLSRQVLERAVILVGEP